MNKGEEITDWFEKEFWINYPRDLSHGRKGSKQEALNMAIKLNPDEELRKKIMGDMKAQIRYDRKDIKPDRWKHGVRYLRHKGWEREIGSTMDLNEKREALELKECSFTDCKLPVHGGHYNQCYKHIIPNKEARFAQIRIDLMEKAKLNRSLEESPQDYSRRCRKSAMKLGGVEGSISKMCEPDPQIR